jgi:hypothetical protein
MKITSLFMEHNALPPVNVICSSVRGDLIDLIEKKKLELAVSGRTKER